MGHVVIITSEMAGRVNVSCELARRLEAAGHRATVASPADIAEQVRAQGLDSVHISGAMATASAEKPRQQLGLGQRILGLIGRLANPAAIRRRRSAKIDALDPEGFRRRLLELEPDLVLIDVELTMQIMSAATTEVPVLTWTTMLALWKRPGLPPLGSAIVVDSGVAGSRMGIEFAWLRFRTWKWLRNQRHRITRLGEDQLSVLSGVAGRVGFPFRKGTARYQWLVPVVFTRLPLLVFNAWPLEYPHDKPARTHYVGPVLNPQRRLISSPEQQAISIRLEELYERRSRRVSQALIYCSFGAWHKGDDGSFFRNIVDAVRPHPEWDVVIGLGGRLDCSALGDIPSNVHVFSWAPQMEVLSHADLAVHHAGISSVNESIVSGVPMVLYPFDFLDQPGNAARVAYHSMGVVGDRDRDHADDIKRRIETVLNESGYREKVQLMRERFENSMHGDPAIQAIIERLG